MMTGDGAVIEPPLHMERMKEKSAPDTIIGRF